MREFCEFSGDGMSEFKRTIESSNLSTRSMDRLAKVGRTVADLDDSKLVELRHLEEAASFVLGGMLRAAF